MEWFASMPLPWVIVIVVALLAIRFGLKRVKEPWAKAVGETAESLALAFGLVFLIIRPFLVQAYFIPSESMVPGLLVNDHLLANKGVYRLRAPRHGEIVVFQAPPAAGEGKKDFIKRCMGTPGDTIEVKPGFVFIGGRQYDHETIRGIIGDEEGLRLKFMPDYILLGDRKITKKDLATDAGMSDAKVVIKPGVVLRNGEALEEPYTNADPDYQMAKVKVPANQFFMMGDNRDNSKDSHIWGFLPRKLVEGKAMFIFYPPTRMGIIR
jgi:signal peptidase I